MAQGNMSESKARLHALPTNSSDHKDSDVKAKNNQHFEDIRDSHKSMVCLIDAIFDYLQDYADAHNKSNNETKLHLHWQRPTLEKLVHSRSWLKTAPEAPGFTGKLYSCDWSLIVKGTSDLITSYIIPSDRVISFNSEPEIYTPYLTIKHVKKNNNYNWEIEKELITHEHLEDLAKRLLERLLKSARSQEWGQSVFCLKSIGIGLASLQGKDTEISKNFAQMSGNPDQFLVELVKAASQTGVKPDEFKINQAGVRTTFGTALKSLPSAIDEKLKQLTKEGGEAFSKHDLKKAQDILTLSNQLNDFKTKIQEIMAAFKIQH
jgi:hypothetical protein